MRHHTLRIAGNGGAHAIRLMVATTAPERMRGLLGRPPLAAAEGMLLLSCRLIHTIGMGYPLDLIYLDRRGRVLKVTAGLVPRRMDGHWRARHVLEMAAGEAARCDIVPGTTLSLDWLGQPGRAAAWGRRL